jgi:ABC-2 type transport system ATP-binding protein
LAERLELYMSLRVREYSSGNKRKLGIVAALMHKPEVLILDEPTGGLDPLVQQTFYQMVREARDQGRTVFLSSHILSEVQAICDRVGILRKGQLKAVERVEDITHTNFRWVTVTFRDTPAADQLAGVPGVTDVSVDGERVKLQLNGDFDPLLRAIGDRYVVDLRVHEPTLEEIFLAFYGNDNGVDKEVQ